MNFLKVAKSDIVSIFKSRFLRVSIIAVILIPLVYAGVYLAAFWDPYGKTENIPVAVVNLDKGAISNDEKVNRGDDIVKNLKDNNDLGWKFLNNLEDAKKGLNGDKYYAVIVIPKDFSSKLEGIKDGDLQKPKLQFISNEKKNYIISLINKKAADALKNIVGYGVVENFTEETFDKLYEVKDGMMDASEGTSELKDGVKTLKDKIPSLLDGVHSLYTGADTFSGKMGEASDASYDLRDGVAKLKDKLPELQDGVNELYEGCDTFNNKMGDASDASYELSDGVLTLKGKIPTLSEGVDKLYDGSNQLYDGIGELKDKVPELALGASKINSGVGSLKDGLEKARSGASKLKTGAGELKNTIGIEGKVLDDVIKASMPSIIAKKGDIENELKSAVVNLLNAKKTIPVLPIPDQTKIAANAGVDKVLAGISGLNDMLNGKSSSDSAEMIKMLSKVSASDIVVGKLLETGKQLEQIETIPGISSAIANINNAAGKAKVADVEINLLVMKQINDGLKDGAAKLEYSLGKGYNPETKKDEGLGAGLNALYDGSEELKDGTEEFLEGVGALDDGVDQLHRGAGDLKDGIGELQSKVPDLEDGTNVLYDGTIDFADAMTKLHDASGAIKDGTKELNDKVPDLISGVEEIHDGTVDFADAMTKLHDGSVQLKDGTKTLYDKIPELQDGVGELYDGASKLNDGITDGAYKLNDGLNATGKQMAAYMNEPVEMKETPTYSVKNYGTGLTPYFVSLGLWVGALMMFFVITDKTNPDIKAGPAGIVLGKYLTYAQLGTIQAIILSIVIMMLGLHPSNIVAYVLFNIFMSWVFIAIIQNFIFLFGDVGRLLAVIVLVLQLTASNGTFPGEVLPKFFKVVGPYLPFTYTISSIREVISGINSNVFMKNLVILLMFMICSLTLSVILKKHADKVKNKVEVVKEEIVA